MTVDGNVCQQKCDKCYRKESDGKYRCVDSCGEKYVLLDSECVTACPEDMYLEENKCVTSCSSSSAVQVLDGKRLCSTDCLYF